jgi:hypothetical protein
MFHRGARIGGGNIPQEITPKIDPLLDEFTEIVAEIATRLKIRRAVVRSLLPCNLIIIYDDANLSIGAQKASGMPSTMSLYHGGNQYPLQEIYEAAKWEFGFDDPFVIQFPVSLLDMDRSIRRPALEAIAQAYVQSEINRMQREMNMIQINPIFGPAAYPVDPRLVFVLMPFDDDLTLIYNEIVKPCVQSQEFNLVCKRADDIKTNKAIIQDIFKAVCEARIIIADMTRLNPNVMYELGVAHTLGKETILIYQREQEIKFPFDLAHIRRIEYENSATGGKKMENDLREVLLSILAPSIQS